jgi:hypothetical protein
VVTETDSTRPAPTGKPAEEVPERCGVGGIDDGVEEGEHVGQIFDVAHELGGRPHREDWRVEHRHPLAPGPSEARVGLVEGAQVGSGELVANEGADLETRFEEVADRRAPDQDLAAFHFLEPFPKELLQGGDEALRGF